VILVGGVAVCLLLLAHRAVIFAIAQLSCSVRSWMLDVFNVQAGGARSTQDLMQCCSREQELLAQYMNVDSTSSSNDNSASSSPTTAAVLSHLGFVLVFFTVLRATLL